LRSVKTESRTDETTESETEPGEAGSGQPRAAAENEESGSEADSFADLALSEPLLEAVRRQGYGEPTLIQRRAIPPALAGKDVVGCAQTGTGKTAAFSLPMIQRLDEADHGVLRGLVITPTRELAQQVERAIRHYGATSSLESTVVHGGVPIRPQIEALEWGCDVVVATPGRLLDHMGRGTVDLGRVEVVVLDEADRMLDMGFIDDVREIVDATPRERQTMLFSATMPPAIRSLANRWMRDPVEVTVGFEAAADGIRQRVHPVDPEEKHELLRHLLREELVDGQVLVFTRTRDTTRYLAEYLGRHEVSVDALHGGKSQDQRTASLKRFRRNETRILVATNVAARGLDIRNIRHVVNFDVPEDPRDYVHRAGRTARADETGDAITLMSPHEWLLVREIEKLTGDSLDREPVAGYEPSVEPLEAREEEPEEVRDERTPTRLSRGRRRRR